MKLRLDLAYPQPRPASLAWALLALGLLAVLWAGWRYSAEAQALADAQARLDKLQPATHVRAPASRRAKAPQETSALATSGQKALTTDWARVLATLETTRGKDIALLSLEADSIQARLELDAQARTLPAMLAYLQGLERAGLQQVRLQTHQVESDEGFERVSFSASAAWSQP